MSCEGQGGVDTQGAGSTAWGPSLLGTSRLLETLTQSASLQPAHAAQSPVSCSVSCWAQGALGAERGHGKCVPLAAGVACGRRRGPEHLVSFRQDEQGMSTGLYTTKWFYSVSSAG